MSEFFSFFFLSYFSEISLGYGSSYKDIPTENAESSQRSFSVVIGNPEDKFYCKAADIFLLQDYLFKFTGRSRSILWGKTDPWKQRYFLLKRVGNRPILEYFNKKPKTKNATPRGMM